MSPAYHPGTGVSTHATPLTVAGRTERYRAQRAGGRLTPRQLCRIRHKRGRAQTRALTDLGQAMGWSR